MELRYDRQLRTYVNERGLPLSEAEILALPVAQRVKVLEAIARRAQANALQFLGLTWDKARKQYRYPNGKYVSVKLVRDTIDVFVQKIAARLERATQDLLLQRIDVATWQVRSKNILKAAFIDADALAKGGIRNFEAHDWTRLANRNRKQFKYLDKFARAVKKGKLSEKQIIARAKSYAAAVRTNYEQARQGVWSQDYTYSKRVLHAMESCSECRAWADKGFVASGVQPVIGTLICGQFCRCTLEFSDEA